MWVYSISLISLSLIVSLTMEIYYRTGITENTDRQTDRQTDTQTHTQTESDTLPKQDLGSSKKAME